MDSAPSRCRATVTPLRSSIVLIVLALAALSCGEAEASSPLELVVDTRARSRPISPYVYGVNGLELTAGNDLFTLLRFGGTRVSTYNWENNASNAGHDPPHHQNDGYLCESTTPGGAVLRLLDRARELGAAALVQVPLIGHVAADRRADGDVNRTPGYLDARFCRSLARGGSDAPDLEDRVVHQDAFVRFVRREAERRSVPVFFALDNEPGGWPVTHPRLREGRHPTYRELARASVEHARMIHEEAPRARVFGPVSFGWPDMRDLAGAPDARGRDFLRFYLSAMRGAERRHGRRIFDVLDVHWYPASNVGGQPVSSGADDPERARLRMQLPRSLYDPSFREPSFIVDDDLDAPIELLPRLTRLIRDAYPGTRLAITEYAYGGAEHPSGAVAQADALGAFGRHGVYAASYWPLTGQRHTYALAAFRMFRRVDGEVSFGDRSIPATSSDLSRLSAWASLDSQHPGRVVIVLVGRAERDTHARLIVRGGPRGPARRFVLDREGPLPREEGSIAPREGAYRVPLPARSVTTLILDPG